MFCNILPSEQMCIRKEKSQKKSGLTCLIFEKAVKNSKKFLPELKFNENRFHNDWKLDQSAGKGNKILSETWQDADRYIDFSVQVKKKRVSANLLTSELQVSVTSRQ